MFSLKIIDTDMFLEMPQSTRLLYYELCMRADDDGFVASPKKIMKMIGCSEDDYKILMSKQYIIPFETGICVIKHWRIHNLIRSDRYAETEYKQEKSMLILDDNKYEFCIQNVIPNGNQMVPQVRLDKVSIDKDSIYIPFSEIIDYLNLKTKSNYKHTTVKTKDLIKARWNENFTLDDFKKVIDNKVFDWLGKYDKEGKSLENYLRPETLFGTKFEGYLNQKSGQAKKDKPNIPNQPSDKRQYDVDDLEKKLLGRNKA